MTLRDASADELRAEIARRVALIRAIPVPGDTGDVFVQYASLGELLLALADRGESLKCRGRAVSDCRPATAPYGVDSWETLVARPSWWARNGLTVRFLAFAAFVAAVLAVACAVTGCSRRDDRPSQAPPIMAAPSDLRVEDDCPGGVCTIPPRRAK